MKNQQKFLLYGANGYTGQLILKLYEKVGIQPILAGRNESKIRQLAQKFGLDYRVVDLREKEKLDAVLKEVTVVLHAAGPFIHTAVPMMEACLRSKTHYLDITGEIPVFENAWQLNEPAKKAGIMLLPGVGFDVVPTDCLALFLKNKLPDATHLKLAFTSIGGGVSHGTAKTMIENLGQEGAVRKDGKIVPVPVGHKTMQVPFGDASFFAISIPWGDVSTAFRTTGIPNIVTYMGIPKAQYKFIKMQRYFGWLLRTNFIKTLAKKQIEKRPAGPSDSQRSSAKSLVWGEVQNQKGEIRRAKIIAPEGYTLTALTALLITKKVLAGNAPAGFQTPAMAYGENLIMEVDGVIREEA